MVVLFRPRVQLLEREPCLLLQVRQLRLQVTLTSLEIAVFDSGQIQFARQQFRLGCLLVGDLLV
jgi:hypothetical protein